MRSCVEARTGKHLFFEVDAKSTDYLQYFINLLKKLFGSSCQASEQCKIPHCPPNRELPTRVYLLYCPLYNPEVL